MVERCPHCEKKIVKYPLRDSNGKIILWNWIRMDFTSVMFLISIILILYGAYQFMGDCKAISDDPCGFCKTSGCCDLLKAEELAQPKEQFIYMPVDITEEG